MPTLRFQADFQGAPQAHLRRRHLRGQIIELRLPDKCTRLSEMALCLSLFALCLHDACQNQVPSDEIPGKSLILWAEFIFQFKALLQVMYCRF